PCRVTLTPGTDGAPRKASRTRERGDGSDPSPRSAVLLSSLGDQLLLLLDVGDLTATDRGARGLLREEHRDETDDARAHDEEGGEVVADLLRAPGVDGQRRAARDGGGDVVRQREREVP